MIPHKVRATHEVRAMNLVMIQHEPNRNDGLIIAWFNFTFRLALRTRQVSISAIDYFVKLTKGKEIVGEMENIGEIETWRNRVLPLVSMGDKFDKNRCM